MKVAEQFFEDGDRLIQKKTHDFNPVLNSAAQLRSSGATGFSENWHIGRIPAALLGEWIKEAGLTWDDTEAVGEIIRRKMLDGDFAALRVHEGTF